ncbi:unnamed protein product [Boreogadus saida]
MTKSCKWDGGRTTRPPRDCPGLSSGNAVRHSSPSITDRRWNSVHNFLKLAEEPPGSLRGRRTLPCSNQAESGQTPPLRPRRKARLKEHLGRQSLETRVKNISEPLQQLSQLGPLLSRNRRLLQGDRACSSRRHSWMIVDDTRRH